MITSHVVIDSNILFKDYRFSSRDLNKLIKTKKMYQFDICIPQIVYDELNGNFSYDFKVKLFQLMKSIDEINKFTASVNQLDRTEVKKKFLKSASKYKARLDKFIKENQIILLPYANITHREIVEKMYKGLPPFTKKEKEVGYKDFLILQSINEYFLENPPQGKVLLFTENVKDFSNRSEVNREKIVEIEQSFEIGKLAIAPSATALFQELSRNLSDKHKKLAFFDTSYDISEKLKKAIESDFLLFEMDIFKNVMLNMEKKDIECQTLDYFVEADEDNGVLEITGTFELKMKCSFSMDSWDLRNIDSHDFVFLKEVKNYMEEKGLSRRDEWSAEFQNVEYSQEFFFNYINFDFNFTKIKKDYQFDSIFLSISKI